MEQETPEDTVELRVLGPLEACHDGGRLDLGSRKQRITLAVLAVNADRYVSVDQLIHELWGEQPIPSAVENTRTYAARLRRLFETTNGGSVRIERMGTGYRLLVDTAAFDLAGFEDDAASGRAALRGGDLDAGRKLLEHARLRWRGQMLDGLPRGPLLDLRCAAIERDLVNLVDELAEMHLSLGDPASAVPLAQEQIRAEPVRERSYELLMRALYQQDGPAAALSVYERARHLLVEQLGLEPGPALRDLQRRILNRDPTLAPPHATITAALSAPVPRQLPPAPSQFVARDAEIAQVRQLLLATGPHRHRPTVAVIYGPGGAGKSALALQVGNQLSEHFPDGQLYVDLLGSTPGIPSPSPAEVLERLLHSLGIHGNRVPTSAPAAAALLRSTTAGKRLLVIVDNATTAEQVAPLVPSTGTCAVLVTSRRPLTALDADHRIRLAPLSRSASQTMFDAFVQHRKIDPTVREAILERCGGLPLAIRIITARLANRPDLSAEQLAQRLANRPLDELQHDGLAVGESIRAGYDALTTDAGPVSQLAARTFRALGTLPLPDFTPGLVAALLAEPGPAAVRPALDHLVDAQLLEPAAPGRYRLHDLVREAAIELAEGVPTADRDRSLQRAVTYYAHAADHASVWVCTDNSMIFTVPKASSSVALPEFHAIPEATTWIDAECDNLRLTLMRARTAVAGARQQWLAMAERLWTFLHYQCRWDATQRLGQLVLETADQQADDQMAGWAHLLCGRSQAQLRSFDQALDHLRQAMRLNRRPGDGPALALTLIALGVANSWRGQPQSALAYYDRAMQAVRGSNTGRLRTVILLNQSAAYFVLHQLDQAATAAWQCIEISRQHGYHHNLGRGLSNLAATETRAGLPDEAVRHASEALVLCDAANDRIGVHELLLIRSQAHLQQQRHIESLADANTALTQARRDGDRYAEAAALWQQARVLSASGHRDHAEKARDQAEDLYQHLAFRRDPIVERLLEHDTHQPSARVGGHA